MDQHLHHEHELFLPLQGEIRIDAGGKSLRAGPGKMIYLPDGTEHSFSSSSSSEGERLIFMLEAKTWKANDGGTFQPSVVSASQLCKELLFHLLLHPKTKAARSLIQTLVQTLSEMLDSTGSQNIEGLAHLRGKSTDARLDKALSFIESNFSKSISSSQLSKAAGMSVRNQNRLFLTELGMTPKQVITLYRVEEAQTLLRNRRMSVTDTALEVGYSSVSQFITVFRNITGKLPSELIRA